MDHSLEHHNAKDHISEIMEPLSGQPFPRSGCNNLISTMLLKHYIERATERVLKGRSNVSLHDCGMILELLRESCIGDIMQNEFQSAVCCGKEINDAVEETIITIEEDSYQKEDIKKLEMDEDSSQEDNLSSYCKPQLEHAPFPRKDVPEIVVRWMRGSLCKFCHLQFKGPDCLERLIEHTKEKHLDKASPRFLKRVREEYSYNKLLGDGIMYCTCSMCIRIGFARFDKRYDKARFMPSKVKSSKYASTQNDSRAYKRVSKNKVL